MLRTALRPKWLSLLALVCAVVVGFTWLGLWQLDVAQKKGQREALAQVESAPEGPLATVLAPQTSPSGTDVGRKVAVSGRYDAAGQIVVVDRRLGDQVGAWVVTPLVDESNGARIAVLRGFVSSPADAPAPPAGRVTVHGVLEGQEGPPEKPRQLPAGQAQSINISALVNVWNGTVYNAFVFATSEDPAATGASARITPVPPPAVRVGGLNWRNAFYAVQWWIFAAFAVYLWWRMLRDEYELDLASARAGDRPDADDAPAPATHEVAPRDPAPSSGGSPA